MSEAILRKRLARTRAKLEVMEGLLEDKSREIYQAQAATRRANALRNEHQLRCSKSPIMR